jgi:predicted HicB family RNase H-like nuclease
MVASAPKIQLNVRLPAQIIKQLKIAAIEKGTSVNKLIEYWIAPHLKDK